MIHPAVEICYKLERKETWSQNVSMLVKHHVDFSGTVARKKGVRLAIAVRRG